jgi:integrase/recombinase XerD
MAGGGVMLMEHVDRYIALRQALGYKMREHKRELRGFARLAQSRGDTHVTIANATAWANMAPSPYARSSRMQRVIQLARFLHAEDCLHEVPSFEPFKHAYARPLPYIYTQEEIGKIMFVAGKLRKQHSLRRETYTTLLGLVAVTGLRASEALNLRLSDVSENGTLRVCCSKFRKSRVVPLHPTAVVALNRYLELRRLVTTDDDHVFISAHGRRIAPSILNYTFRRILKIAKIAPERKRAPRIHDLRHTFATRSLEKCPSDRKSIAKHFVALSTYLGHVDIKSGYWYLESTPELMGAMATAAENFVTGGAQ